jgi:hypothetical protein
MTLGNHRLIMLRLVLCVLLRTQFLMRAINVFRSGGGRLLNSLRCSFATNPARVGEINLHLYQLQVLR